MHANKMYTNHKMEVVLEVLLLQTCYMKTIERRYTGTVFDDFVNRINDNWFTLQAIKTLLSLSAFPWISQISWKSSSSARWDTLCSFAFNIKSAALCAGSVPVPEGEGESHGERCNSSGISKSQVPLKELCSSAPSVNSGCSLIMCLRYDRYEV